MYILTIIIIIAMFSFDLTLSILNYKNRNKPIPDNVADVYDKEDYKKWHAYTMEVFRLGMVSKIMNTIILLLFLHFGVFPKIAEMTQSITTNSRLQVLLFFAIYMIISYVLNFGFKLYSTFHIEERYGFNKTTVKTFITDQIKSLILVTVLGGGLMYLILSLYEKLGVESLFFAWLILIVITLIINMLYTRVFIKIFNKLTPLPKGELYDKTVKLAKNLGYEIKTISVMDASKRSTRLNAFFTGFGKFKSIVLYDTLLEKCDPDEIVSVIAHEIGHAINKDTLKNFILSIGQLGLLLYLLSFFLTSETLSTAFGFGTIHVGFSIILFGILFEPISMIMGIPLNAMSRKAEYKADACAAGAGYKDAMISTLKILSRENFSNLTPHPLLVMLTYSHPPTSQRIEALKNDHR